MWKMMGVASIPTQLSSMSVVLFLCFGDFDIDYNFSILSV